MLLTALSPSPDAFSHALLQFSSGPGTRLQQVDYSTSAYRAVTCLLFSEDQSLLQDGSVRVWIFDEERQQRAGHLYEYSFSEHALPVTDIVTGYGGSNAIIISSSLDRTCKIWSLARGKLLRNIVFPCIIDAIALDPGENVFYAGGRDGKIYIAELNSHGISNYSYGLHILGILSDQSKPICSLAFALDGIQLLAGSDDGMVRVWDTKTHNIVRVFKHSKGPVNNILVIRQEASGRLGNNQGPMGRRHVSLPPPLEKYSSIDEHSDFSAYIAPQPDYLRSCGGTYTTVDSMNKQINELQQNGSCGASEMEMERLKVDNKRWMQMVEEWKTNVSKFASTLCYRACQ